MQENIPSGREQGRALPEPIKKDLDAEARIREKVGYRRMAGASRIENFRSPDFYVFLLFEKCSGVHSVDFVEYEQKDLQVHISFPGQIHSWDTGPEAIGQKLLISRQLVELAPFADHFLSTPLNRFPLLDLSQEDFRKLDYEFAATGRALGRTEFAHAEVNLRLQLIIAMLDGLVAKQEQRETGNIHPLIISFRNLVDRRYRELRLVADYAALLHVTPNYLNILCRRSLGLPAKELISQRLLLESKRLLLGSGMRIKEIAYELGFPDISGFSTYIKEKTGLSPRDIKGGNAHDTTF